MTDSMPPSSLNPSRPKASAAKVKAELRKAIRRNAHEPDINFLNITAMLDIMTIILVFLLKSLGESTATVPQSDDLQIPTSVLNEERNNEGVVLTVTKSQILLGDDIILKLPSRESLAQSGVGARFKRSGPNDLFIVPLGNALRNARNIDKQIRAARGKDPSTSEAIIVADNDTPYRLLIEVLFTLGQSEFGKYHLMVMQGK